jgi:hypothetical protein
MTGRLLDRQAKLLEYLTSRGAIFGARTAALDPALQGIDRDLLDLEARFSHEKRMEKIAGVFPVTFAVLGPDAEALVRDFADTCPPQDIGRIENARQFHGFLFAANRVSRTLALQPWLPDVAACDLACAEARLRADAEVPAESNWLDALRPAIRRSRRVVLLRTAFDIRCVFEGSGENPPERNTYLAVAWIAGEPRILDLTVEIFEVLAALEQWVALGDLPGADDLAAELIPAGLLELRH